VARRLAEAGAPVLDLDRLAHELMAPGQPAHREVAAAFGPGILTPSGHIDRPRLGAVVFGDPAARERLNAIVHPRVRSAEAEEAERRRAEGAPLLVTEAALLVESGLHLRFDRLVAVVCAPEAQLARLRERDGLDEGAARARIASQMPVATKRHFAHEVIDTGRGLEETREEAGRLYRRLVRRAAAPAPRVQVDRPRALGGLVHGASVGPRGLTTADLAGHLAECGGLDLPRLARRLAPASDRPWHELGAEVSHDGAVASGLVVPLALFELRQHGFDEGRLAASAHSLSWLLERGDRLAADAVFSALAVAEAASAPGRLDASFEGRVAERFRRGAPPFARETPSPRLWAALRSAAAHPDDVAQARRQAAEAGAPSDIAGALVGLEVGSEAPADGGFARFLELPAGPTG